MKVTIWTTALSWGKSHELVVTAHASQDEARRMVEHALRHESIDHWDGYATLGEVPLAELKEAWEYHFDGPCLIERHEVEVPLAELDQLAETLRDIVGRDRLQKAVA